MPTPSTPLVRRSRRGQPIANAFSSTQKDDKWHGQRVHERAMNPDLDMLPDQRMTWEEQDADERESYKTIFYNEFRRRNRDGVHTLFKVGDTVTVNTMAVHNGDRKPSVAVIVSMWELVLEDDEEEAEDGDENVGKLMVRIHWFLRPSELPRHRAKRECLENEIYYSLDADAIFLSSSLLGLCEVTDLPPRSLPAANASPRKNGGYVYVDEKKNKTLPLYCRYVIDSGRNLYYEVNWVGHRRGALAEPDEPWGSGEAWKVQPVVERTGMPPRKKQKLDHKPRKRVTIKEEPKQREDTDSGDDNDDNFSEKSEESDPESDHELPKLEAEESDSSEETPDESESDADMEGPKTPRRKRTAAHATPHSKAALKRRRKTMTMSPRKRPSAKLQVRRHEAGLGYDTGANLPQDPWLRAMQVLHVGSRPDALPCRDDEFTRVLGAVYDLLEEGSGGCVYISGVPGTGKTATVHAVVRELKRMAESNETNPFTYVEINGLRIPEPNAAYSLLWEVVSGHDVAKDGHMKVGAKESLRALTTYFSGGGSRGPSGHACVVLMDELDQLMTTKQDVVYNFFNWPTLVGSKLVVLAVANTMDLPERAMTGRVRSRLGMTRINFAPYTAEQLQAIVEARIAGARVGLPEDSPVVLDSDAIKLTSKRISATSGDARRILDICRRVVELAHPQRRKAVIKDVSEVTKQMQNSPTATYLRDCSFHERLVLLSLIRCIRTEGIEEIKWENVLYQHSLYVKSFEDPDAPRLWTPTPNEMGLVLESLVSSQAILLESGAAAMKKMLGERKVVLNMEQNEVERVLGEVGGERWKIILS
ncbi:Origin recognition complex subunit 1 [Mycena indigotica]|uniref:Origin recognition complex subunit 1 n=1 Tax=Mycena indigotica TaxID=2126181 RepID=A0A8H6W687_9AGAR|nr:Origin recognition complex subunit 1 [Mycena indigotica]KAF7306437.1 Origin recognition complex subunit 1 [Mycena indigotica]